MVVVACLHLEARRSGAKTPRLEIMPTVICSRLKASRGGSSGEDSQGRHESCEWHDG